jgi:hypothetical protein
VRTELGLHLGSFGPSLGDARAIGLGTTATVVVGSLTAGAFTGRLLEIVPHALAYGLAAGLVAALAWIVFEPTLRVQVFELGLRAPGFLPPAVAIRFSEIQAIDEFRNASGAYLRLHRSQGGRCAYLPIGLAHQPDFCRIVAARAGPAHPLALALAARA